MPRFKVGDRVEITDVIFSGFVGQTGIVREVHPHRTGKTTLDRYSVEFDDSERKKFWDIQLMPAPERQP
jgi:transcription antitermination factor NusG